MGENFGICESIMFIFAMGLSSHQVVQVVHLYSKSVHQDRESRAHYALRELTKTIFGSSIVLIFSCIALLRCEAKPLNNLGYLLVTTSVMSVVTSIIFLPSLLAAVGPEKDEG